MFDERQCAERLRCARTLREASEVAADTLRAGLPGTSCNVFPLMAGTQPERDAANFHEDFDGPMMLRKAMDVFAMSERDLGNPWLCAGNGPRTYDITEKLGEQHVWNTEVFHEFWEPYHVARQVLGLMGPNESPIGFICATRRKARDAFLPQEMAIIDSVRGMLESTYLRIHGHALACLPGTLRMLEAEVSVPCAVFDGRGTLVWMSNAAREELGIRGLSLAGVSIPVETSPQLEEWRAVACEAAAVGSHSMASRDGLKIRALSLGREGQLVLVRGRSTRMQVRGLRARGLTEREAEIALLVSSGLTTEGIALELGIRIDTVRTHLKNVFRTLRVTSRLELALLLSADGDRAPRG